MLNVRRSALYIAILGLGFAAGEASAACAVGQRTVTTYPPPTGAKVTTCVKTGSEIVQVILEPFDGGEAPFTSATLNVSLIGTSPDGYPPTPPCNDCLLIQSPTLNPTKPTKPPKPPKSKQCAISVPNDDGDDDGEFDKRQVPCQIVGDPSVPPNLVDSSGNPVDMLDSPLDAPMNCNPKKLNCQKTVEILPTGLFCADITPNKPAIDFTAKPDPDNSFVLVVEIEAMRPVENIRNYTQYLGCYALTGRNYSCEDVMPLSEFAETPCAGSVGNYIGTAGSSPNYYCATGSLPAGDLFCGV